MATNHSNLAERIADAWHQHRQGQDDAAIKAFEAIVKSNPDDIDANYGLGLAQKAAGQQAAAIATFQRTLQMVQDARQTYTTSRNQEHHEDNIKTPEDDRFQMLYRMVNQRLTELNAAAR